MCILIYNQPQVSTLQKLLVCCNLSWCSNTHIIRYVGTYTDISLMIKNIPSSFEYRFRRDLEQGTRRFQCFDYDVGHGRVNSSPKRKDSPRDLAPCQISWNRCSGEARSRKPFSILFAMNNETTQSFPPI